MTRDIAVIHFQYHMDPFVFMKEPVVGNGQVMKVTKDDVPSQTVIFPVQDLFIDIIDRCLYWAERLGDPVEFYDYNRKIDLIGINTVKFFHGRRYYMFQEVFK